jgi:hypothetical protein
VGRTCRGPPLAARLTRSRLASAPGAGSARRFLGPRHRGCRLLGPLPPQDQKLADVLDRRRVQSCADALQHRIALIAQVTEHPNLDKFVREEIDV